MDTKFLKNYFSSLKDLLNFDEETYKKLIEVKKILLSTKKKNKVMIFGNGGSAAISSHFSVDITKNAGIRCCNYNEADLITCFSNDYGYEKWVEKAINFYGDPGDVLIIISTGGKSQNIVNGCKAAKKKKFKKIITLTGHQKNNPVSKAGNINFHVQSKAYNLVENVHQILLLSIIDLIIGNEVYPVN